MSSMEYKETHLQDIEDIKNVYIGLYFMGIIRMRLSMVLSMG